MENSEQEIMNECLLYFTGVHLFRAYYHLLSMSHTWLSECECVLRFAIMLGSDKRKPTQDLYVFGSD